MKAPFVLKSSPRIWNVAVSIPSFHLWMSDRKRDSAQCLLGFTDENGPLPGATVPMLQLSAGNLCHPLPQLPTLSELEFGTIGRWVSEPKVRQSDQKRSMQAQMLETSQLEGLWLEVLLHGEKKRFSNDPQLTRGLVLIFFLLAEIIKKPNWVQECCRPAVMSLHCCVNIEDNEVLCVCVCM